ncbi:MAG: hypothetical protein IJC12_03280 [Peptococcaceae bacterium]|nr:hypothetical protein [Peptococcaceae bacterium]
MYDWNHNGKHDAFDDAMFHALLEDDLEKNHPTKHKRTNISDSGDLGCSIGCGAVVAVVFYILLTLIGF